MPRKKAKQLEAEIPDRIFHSPTSSVRNFRLLHELFLASGSTFGVSEFTRMLVARLEESPDPDMVVTNLVRFVESSPNKASLFNDLLRYPPLMEVAATLFGNSRYFSDILVRDPELFRWLTASGVLNSPYVPDQFVREALRILSMFREPARRLDALRRFYRREILRIGTRDIVVQCSLAEITGELSMLADTIIEASRKVALDEMQRTFGGVPETDFAVIGLGKLGGNELNYSSDIDVMFVYRDDGEFRSQNGKEISNHEFYVRFAEKIVQYLSETSHEGHLYRVDTRLRPEGSVGSLARSLAGCMTYYESRGDLWERQMLIKARPVAGDIAFGTEFISLLTPFVYPRTHFTHPAESIARIKARIESELSEGENIKLMAGGIRDIEFAVQALQLVHGGRKSGIRGSNTVDAIRKLELEGLVSAGDAQVLVEGYELYRTIEHRLQMMQNTQTHTMPPPGPEKTALARRLGFGDPATMKKEVGKHLRAVRRIFDDVMRSDAPDAPGHGSPIFAGELRAESDVLSRFGFRDPRKALRNFRLLLTGTALGESAKANPKVAEAVRKLADPLLTDIGQTRLPDLTLRNFSLLASGQAFPEQFYGQLMEPGFRKLVVRVASLSPRLVKGLLRYPSVLDTVAAQLPISFRQAPGEEMTEFKNRRELHAGILNILDITDFDELTSGMTAIADEVVRSAADSCGGSQAGPGISLALFALGKYGTYELSFDGDLDILLICEAANAGRKEEAERAAQCIVREAGRVTERGNLYEVDTRLRPEGRNAPLITDFSAYRKYLRERSSLWERQSLTRLRLVWGDRELGKRVKMAVARHVYQADLPGDWIKKTVAMRKSMETRSRTGRTRFMDIKLGSGGMVDLEFMAQMVQLAFGESAKELRGLRTAEVLRRAPSTALPGDTGDRMAGHYMRLRELEKLIHITLEDRGTVLPVGEKLEVLASSSGYGNGKEMHADLTSSMKQVREEFLRFAGRLEKVAR